MQKSKYKVKKDSRHHCISLSRISDDERVIGWVNGLLKSFYYPSSTSLASTPIKLAPSAAAVEGVLVVLN